MECLAIGLFMEGSTYCGSNDSPPSTSKFLWFMARGCRVGLLDYT